MCRNLRNRGTKRTSCLKRRRIFIDGCDGKRVYVGCIRIEDDLVIDSVCATLHISFIQFGALFNFSLLHTANCWVLKSIES